MDVAQCAVPTSYVAACLLSLTAMLRLELPHINILTKMDMANRYDLAMPLVVHQREVDMRYPTSLHVSGPL